MFSAFFPSQDELNSDLDLSEARASLLSGDVVELINATSVDSTSMKLLWEVSKKTGFVRFGEKENFSPAGSGTKFKYLIHKNNFFPFFPQIINGKYVEGFYIYARNVPDTSHDNELPSYKMLTVLNAGSGASSCKISGLRKFTTYEFFVVPFYKAVEGKPSNSRIARTLEDGEFTLNYALNFA